MTLQASSPLQEFQWSPQPAAAELVRALVADFVARNGFAADLSRRMKEQTGTRFYDWVEAIFVPASAAIEQKLRAVGYEDGGERGFSNPHGMFPRIGLHASPITAVHIKVGSVVEFADVWRHAEKIEGEAGAPYRRVLASRENNTELFAAERWGYTGFDILRDDPARGVAMERTLES